MSSELKLKLGLADLCVADFWGGHHLPHVQIPVHKHTTADEVRAMLTQEVAMGAVARLPEGWDESPEWYAAARKAIAELEIYSDEPFAGELEEGPPEDGVDVDWLESDFDDVYAFFVFEEVESGDD